MHFIYLRSGTYSWLQIAVLLNFIVSAENVLPFMYVLLCVLCNEIVFKK